MHRLFTLLLLLCLSATAQAYGSLRCQGKMIRPGMSMSQVTSLCGAPRDRIVEEIPVRSRIASGFARFSGVIVIESWEYDRGWGKFPAVLKFQDGTLKRVEYLDYRSRGHAGH